MVGTISTLYVLRLLSDQAEIQHLAKTSVELLVVVVGMVVGVPLVVVVVGALVVVVVVTIVVVVDVVVLGVVVVGVVVVVVGVIVVAVVVVAVGVVVVVVGAACLFRRLFAGIVVVVDVVDVVVFIDVDVNSGYPVESHEVVKSIGIVVEAIGVKCWKPMA